MIGGHVSFISQELDRMGYKMATYLEREGFKTFHQLSTEGGVDDRYLLGLMSLKHAAVAAGIGVFGKNSLILTPEYGPRVRLTAILTDAGIEPDNQLSESFCQDCRICVETCPAAAFLSLRRTIYNHVRPHQELSHTPGEEAGIDLDLARNRLLDLIETCATKK